jgi:hypothetical protein
MFRLDAGFRVIRRVSFSPDGRALLAWTQRGPTVQWSLADPTRIEELRGAGHDTVGERSADLSCVAEPMLDYDVAVDVIGLQVASGPDREWVDEDLQFTTLKLAFSPDGSRLWGVGSVLHPRDFSSRVLCWDSASGHRLLTLNAPENLDWVIPSSDGQWAVGRPGSATELFFLNVADESWQRTGPLPARVHAVAWCPDGRTVVAGLTAGIALADASTGRLTARSDQAGGPVAAVAAHPHRPLLLAAAGESVHSWRYDDGLLTPLRSFDWQIGRVTGIAIAPDGMLAAAGGADGQVAVWDLED